MVDESDIYVPYIHSEYFERLVNEDTYIHIYYSTYIQYIYTYHTYTYIQTVRTYIQYSPYNLTYIHSYIHTITHLLSD